VEIQALTIPAKGTISRVFSDKIDSGRVSRVSAALEKHLGLRLSDQDLYVNAAGGIRITEVGVELALAGEIRPVRRLAGRVKTAANLGFGSFLGPIPVNSAESDNKSGENPPSETQLVPDMRATGDIKSAIKLIFGAAK